MDNIDTSQILVFVFGLVGFGWGLALVLKGVKSSNSSIQKKGFLIIAITFLILFTRTIIAYFGLY